MRPPFGRHLQPLQHGADALGVGDLSVVGVPERRVDPLDRRLGSRPEKAGAHHPLLLGGDPDRFAAVPRSIADDLRVGIDVRRLAPRVVEPVRDDAMAARVEAGHEGVVIGKGERREDRDHAFRPRAAAHHATQVGERHAVEVFGFEAVQRHEHEVRLLPLLRTVDAAAARLLRARAPRGVQQQQKSEHKDGDRRSSNVGHRPSSYPSRVRQRLDRALTLRTGDER